MTLNQQLSKLVDVKPRLTVVGVGGAGCNAVNNMIAAGLQGVEFVVANTDAQCLAASSAEHRIQLGASLTEGLGAGSKPEIGEAAAEEAIEEIRGHVNGSHMVFIAAGMGGGTGTGAASVIARVAREMGALTVGIVTKPFQFEGARRMRTAEAGVQSLRNSVDTLIVIPNQNLFRIANERTTFAEAFVLADQVLYSGVACIVDLVLKEGLINLDFADVRTVMSGMGTAMMGTGEASGDRRAILAAEEAIANPLLDDVTLRGARGLLLSITGGRDLTLYEVDEAASRVREEVDPDCNIIVGATFDENLGERVRVSIVASGMRRVGEVAPTVTAQPAPAAPFVQTNVRPSNAPPVSAAFDPLTGQLGLGHAVGAAMPGHMPAANGAVPPPMPDELHRKLAQAFAPAQPAMHAQPQYAPHPANEQSVTNIGGVLIEDGFTPFGHSMQRPTSVQMASPPSIQAEPATTYPSFEPQVPVEIRRSQRRMPTVEELPPVGQREWHARQNTAQQQPQGLPEEGRKRGFFDKLTGRRGAAG